jgi:hypothetical protein
MHTRQFASENAARAYAEPNGLVCLLDSKFSKWQQRLPPGQYEMVEVRTKQGPRTAMLLPKAALKAAWEADPLRKALLG